MTTTAALRVYYHDGAEEWVIAESPADALEIAMKCSGCGADDYEGYDFEPWDAAATIRIMCNSDGHPDDSGEFVTRTCAEWVEREGRGVLCSRNY